MNAQDFIRKWQHVALSERSACQQHFLDLCELMAHPKPAEVDRTGESFTFERGAEKSEGGQGWADVWKKGFFGWEYKGRHANLAKAYNQLLQYREALENPPLLVVCDMDVIEIRTNFTGTRTEIHRLPLASLDMPRSQEVLSALFFAPEKLRPGATSQAITADAAARVGALAQKLRDRGEAPQAVARFLDRLVFCFFAEDAGLLPEALFSRLLSKTRGDPERFQKLVSQLFAAMATGGDFGMETIRHFDGALFAESQALSLKDEELDLLEKASGLDWSAVDPSIFGTLFERGLDPDKRSQLGAHYTSRQDIETLVEPVVFGPLRREWEEVKARALEVLAPLERAGGKPPGPQAIQKIKDKASGVVGDFLLKLHTLTVLDPACGSGNFLYVVLQKLKDFEKQVSTWTGARGLGTFPPLVHPRQLYGIEINPYAHELAQMTVWIGYLQWIKANGFGSPNDPILEPLEGNFQNKDAILDLTDPGHPKEPNWPDVDCIVGNPPFLGDKLMRRQLGDEYVEKLRTLYAGRIPGQSDLCCYWFEKARTEIEHSHCKRAGLLATQGIRGGANRKVLERIKETGDIFFAESDRPWILDGANVHVSMVGFDGGQDTFHTFDGHRVEGINASLSITSNTAGAGPLAENKGLGFIGVAQKAPFGIPDRQAASLLLLPNPHGLPNSDVIRPICNAIDITRRSRNQWNIDFGVDKGVEDSALYELPYEHVVRVVKPLRENHREKRQARSWWLFARTCPDMRQALEGLSRYLATPRVSKFRLFVWLTPEVLCDSAAVAFARNDDYFFGVLHSRFHEVWSRAQATQLREASSGTRYTPTTCFETFPFPWPPGQEPKDDPKVIAIAQAAMELNTLREAWLNPPEWTKEEILEFPGSIDGPWARFVVNPDARGIGAVRYPRLVPKDEERARLLAKRTLTALYNQRPAWLALAHQKLDDAVAEAYAFPSGLTPEELLEKLLDLNLERSSR